MRVSYFKQSYAFLCVMMCPCMSLLPRHAPAVVCFPCGPQCEQVLQAQCSTDTQLSITDPRTAREREVKWFSSKYFLLKIISFCIKALLISFPIIMCSVMSLSVHQKALFVVKSFHRSFCSVSSQPDWFNWTAPWASGGVNATTPSVAASRNTAGASRWCRLMEPWISF